MSAYDCSDSELLDRFGNVCARLGSASVCIDPGAGYAGIEMQYLRGAILARLRNEKPPFQAKQVVRLKSGERDGGYRQPATGGKPMTISRVFFESLGRWMLTFREINECNDEGYLRDRYLAQKYEVVTESAS